MSTNDVFDGDPFDPEQAQAVERKAEQKADTETEQRYKALARRREAYVRVFVTGNSAQEDRDIVHDDMVKFCRGEESTFHVDERVHCLLEGRREYFHRVMDHTRLPQDALWMKYNGKSNEG